MDDDDGPGDNAGKYLNKDTASPPPGKITKPAGGPGGKGGNPLGPTASYAKCLVNRTPSMRRKYCKDEFQSLPNLKSKCNKNFCDFCCERSVPWIHRNHLFTCKRHCTKLAKKDKKKTDFKNICINVEKPQYSIYSYCDDHFREFQKTTLCKLDTCRVCCVTTDQVTKQPYSLDSLQKCFKLCAETFVVNPPNEIS